MATYCIPTLGGVPGSNAGFDWWTGSQPDPAPLPPDTLQYSPDNPDWLRSFSLSEGNGANRDYTFRALQGFVGPTKYLLLSFLVRVSTQELTISRVNFLLGTSPNYVAIQATLKNAATRRAGHQNDNFFSYRIQGCSVNAGNISANGAPDSDDAQFETTSRMWVDVVAPGRQLQTKWAFQVAIPLGVNWTSKNLFVPNTAGSKFKFWYEVFNSTAPNAATLHQMTGVPLKAHTVDANEVIPDPTNHAPGEIDLLNEANLLEMSTDLGGTCTAGVTLNSSQIGTRNQNNTPRGNPWTIQLDLGKAYPPNIGGYNTSHTPDVTQAANRNMFFATPTLNGANAAFLRARFSLANWGSQLTTTTANSWRPIPGLEDVHHDGTDMRHVWPNPGEDLSVGQPGSYLTPLVRNINAYLNAVFGGGLPPAGSQNPHQCMLVELSSTDPSVIITTSSTYANMNVADASVFRRHAAISVEGLAPISAKPRDVYLYLQTYNMPTVVKPRPNDDRRTGGPSGLAMMKQTAVGGTQRPPEIEDIAEFHPTYTVHCYHDTGEIGKREDGTTFLILRPQTAFGYFVVHEGPLVGWDSRIYGAEKLTEFSYVIRVPNGKSVFIETALQAREKADQAPLPDDRVPPPPKGKGCLAGLLGIFMKNP